MRKEKTWTEIINERIQENVCAPFITWDMLKIDPYKGKYHHLTYEGRLTFEIMAKLDYEYVVYGEVFTDRKFDRRKKGFKPTLKALRSGKLTKLCSLSQE